MFVEKVLHLMIGEVTKFCSLSLDVSQKFVYHLTEIQRVELANDVCERAE